MSLRPYAKRIADGQYLQMLRRVLFDGHLVKNRPQGVGAYTSLANPPMTFHFANGVPLDTLRNLNVKTPLGTTIWQAAIGEIFAFVNGATTQTQLEEFGCSWWADWVTPEKTQKRGLEPGELGPASYGGAFAAFPLAGGPVNQFWGLINQILDRPELRTHIITPFVPGMLFRYEGHTQRVVVVPCHGLMFIHMWSPTGNGIQVQMVQRSGDLPVGVPANMIQYTALIMALAHALGKDPDDSRLIHIIADAHIYEDQVPAVERMIERKSRPFPTLTLLNPPQVPSGLEHGSLSHKRAVYEALMAFRHEHFELSDYHPHSSLRIPVAV